MSDKDNTDKQRIKLIESFIRQHESDLAKIQGDDDPYEKGLLEGYISAYRTIVECMKDGLI